MDSAPLKSRHHSAGKIIFSISGSAGRGIVPVRRIYYSEACFEIEARVFYYF
jgi:hypothetical protein